MLQIITKPSLQIKASYQVNTMPSAVNNTPDFENLPERYGWQTENGRGYRINEQLCGTTRPLRVVAIGAGAAGICLAKYLPDRLDNVALAIYEKNPEFGGTWFENKYVGWLVVVHMCIR